MGTSATGQLKVQEEYNLLYQSSVYLSKYVTYGVDL